MLRKENTLQFVYQNNSSSLEACMVSYQLKKSFAFAVFLCLFGSRVLEESSQIKRPVCVDALTGSVKHTSGLQKQTESERVENQPLLSSEPAET